MRPRIPVTLIAVLTLLALPSTAAAARYVVRAGDTLTWIAEAHGTTLGHLAHMNRRNPYATLLTGTVLRVPGRSHPTARASGPTRPYVVQWGDTLTFIAERAHTSAARLAQLNGMSITSTLFAGSTLSIPASAGAPAPKHHARGHASRPGAGWRGRYRVRPGDTLSAIAARHGVGLHRLARANGLQVRGVLLSGARLRVPARSASPSVPAAPWNAGWSIDHWSAHYGVDVHLVRAIAWQESGWNPSVTSSAGAWGAMQVMPPTWRYVERSLVGSPVAHTPDGDVRVGVALLHHLLGAFNGDEALAVAAYYQGEAATRAFGVLQVSRAYVANVMALRTRM
jgi:soluble lytic murein transglycosylase-like protein